MTTKDNAARTTAEARRRLLAQRLKVAGARRRENAEAVSVDGDPASGAAMVVPAARPADGRIELTGSQRRLWLHQQVEPASTSYNIVDAVRLTGPLDPALLRAAAGEVVRRHETLRTTFHARDGVPYAQVHQMLAPEVTVLAKSSLDNVVATVANRPFDLVRGPLLRLTVLAESPGSHVLVIAVHHIVGDGWSMSLLVGELTSAYLRLSGRAGKPAAALPVSWTDVVLRQSAQREAGAFAKQLDHWRGRLGEPSAPPASTGGSAGGTVAVMLPPQLVGRLGQACREQQVTPYMALLGAFATVLARRTGTEKPVVGSPVAGRTSPDVESLIGYFANTLPIVVDTTGAPTVAQLWRRCRTATLGALANQDVSLAEISEFVRPGTPLFQALFALQNYPYEPVVLDEITVTPLALPKHEAKLDLSLYLWDRDGSLEGYLEHRSARFDAEAAQRITADLIRTVTAMVADPHRTLASIDAVPAGERAELLGGRAGPVRKYPRTTLPALFEETVRRTPDAVALVGLDGTELTYAQTDARANQLAHLLISRGIRTGDRVALRLERGVPLILAMLAVTKVGAAFVPIDPAYPAERAQAMIQGSGAAVTITSIEPDEATAFPAVAPARSITPDDLAYMIYTSGSTGVPKGIGITHRGVVNHNLGCVEVFGLTSADRVLHFSSPSFDASIEEIFPALAAGARVVTRAAGVHTAFAGFDRFVAERGITVLGLPTAYWEHWQEHLRGDELAPPETVRVVTLSGQRVNPDAVRRWQDSPRTAPVTLINTYGPTEATVTTSTWAGVASAEGDIPIGAPWPNYRAYVLDENLHLLPGGVVGELCIGGPGVSLGYLGVPADTAERFVPDPFATEPSARMYRTGDYVRWSAGGQLEFVGRIDSQVKVRGNRVELGEVESALTTHPAVSRCAVLAYPDGHGDQRLGAHVVLRAPAGATDLAAHLAVRLPAYMVPAGFRVHDELPVTANGKVDHRRLPEPIVAPVDAAPPQGPHEEALAALWLEVLKLDAVGRTDDFFARGGTSLTATVLVSRIERDLDRSLPLAELFANSTLAAMAARIPLSPQSRIQPIEPAPAAADHPVSPAQRQIFLIQRQNPSSTSYNIPMALSVSGPASPDALRAALQALVDRHESLRTTFHVDLETGEVRQKVSASMAMPFTSGRSDVTELIRPFDLGDGPLIRANWNPDGVLFLDIHHVAADGESLRILVEEFLALFDGAGLPAVPVQYPDFTNWQRSYQEERASALTGHWERRVTGLPNLRLPYDRPRPAQPTHEGFTTTFTVPAADAAALAEAARSAGASLNVALLVLFGTLLGRWAGQTETVIGSLVAGRRHPDLERTVGMFANFLPIRVAGAPGDTLITLLERTRDTVLDDYDHQDLPFDEIVALAGNVERSGRNPLFDAMLIFHPDTAAWDERRAGGCVFTAIPVRHGTAKLDLKLDVFPAADGTLRIQAEAARELFDPTTVDRFNRQFTALCAAAAADPAGPVAALAALTAEETAALAAARTRAHGRVVDVAVVGSHTTEPLAEPLTWWGEQFKMRFVPSFAGYGQVFQELCDPASAWNSSTGPAVLLVRFDDWLDTGDRQRTYAELVTAVRGYSGSAPRIVVVTPATDELDRRWRTDLAGLPFVTVVDMADAVRRYGLTTWDDPAAYELGRVPYTGEYFAVAAAEITRRIVARLLPPFKVIAVDADNTLWQGVAGENGPEGVCVDEAAAAVQRLLLRKRSEGVLLALVSKNAESDARAVFERNDEMLLHWEHFAAVRANWATKSQNLREIAEELSLGLDSFVFLDDSPAEITELAAALPAVLPVRLPADRAEHALFLEHVWAFDTAEVTDDDRQRADRYQAEQQRQESERSARSVEDFLAGMGLRASFTPVAADERERAAQLTRRTNQFNLSQLRMSTEELDAHLDRPGADAYVVRVSDRFGDHGLTGVVLTTIADDVLRLDNVLLSCRVLGRTVEEAILAGLRRVAAVSTVETRFTATERNEPARAFLDRYGFQPCGDGVFALPFGRLPERPRFVKLQFTPLETATAPALYPLDHVGVAVADSEGNADALTALGFVAGEPVYDPAQRSHLRMFTHPDRPSIELVSPASPDSPINGLLQRFGEQAYHLCYEVPTLTAATDVWEKVGIRFEAVGAPTPAVLFGGRWVQFFSIPGVGLIELIEGPGPRTTGTPERDAELVLLVAEPDLAERFFTGLGYRRDTAEGRHVLRRAASASLVLECPVVGPLAEMLAAGGPRPLETRFRGVGGKALPVYVGELIDAAETTAIEPTWPDSLPAVEHPYLTPLRYPTARALYAAGTPKGRATGGGAAYREPAPGLETAIAVAFAEVLGVDRVGADDGFFALGGHSLRAVAALAHLHRHAGRAVDLQQLFDHPTPATLAVAAGPAEAARASLAVTAGRMRPMSATQRRFWVLHQMNPHDVHYNLPHMLRIDGPLDVDRVRSAFRGLLDRHEVLRTSLRLIDDEPVQIVHGMDEIDASITVTHDEPDGFIRPFDLEHAPLLRLAVAQLPGGESHVLAFDVHHIAADGVALALLIAEFRALYEGHELAPARQYADWAAYEATDEHRRALARHEDYWLGRFAELPPPIDLPLDFPRPAVQSTAGDALHFSVPAAGVEALARSSRTTGYAVLLAALYVTLWRHTGQRDLVVGSPFAGRTLPETEAMAGAFLNTLPIRGHLDSCGTVAGLIAQVSRAAADALVHQAYPFEQLVEKLGVDRDASRNPLFDVMFSYQNLDFGGDTGERLGEATVRRLDAHHGRSLFDLELAIRPDGDRLDCRLDFATRLFRRETAASFADRYQRVLAQITEIPDQPLAEVDVLTAQERAMLTSGVGFRSAPIPAGETVLSRISRFALEDPSRPAFAGGRTYGELIARAGGIAGALAQAGIRREDRVGILARRGTAFAEAVLGTWRAGGAYVPLDPRHPAARSAGVLADAGCRVLIADPALLTDELVVAFEGVVLPITAAGPVPPESAAVTQDDLAYILFTSGSTGRPKGAMVEQCGMLNHMLAKAEDLAFDEHSALVQNASQCFDISVWQFFGALVTGGRTVVCPDEVAADPSLLLEAVRANDVTVLEVVPSLLDVMLDLLETEPVPLPSLRALVPTGEALPHPLIGRWLAVFPDVPMVNAYGPTEASDDITHHVLTTVPEDGVVPIGRSISNARLYVIEDSVPLDTPGGTALTPYGVKGEICVAGPCVGRGYVGDLELTAAVFRDDPFVGGRLYRTGDVGRWLPDGTLEFLGRKDQQVKIRGHRIELGEIDRVLDADAEVAAGVVIVGGRGADAQLVGYVVPVAPVAEHDGWAADLRDRLASRLPEYMIPSVIVVLNRLPLTPNGKIDRKALPAADLSAGSPAGRPPSGQAEELVAKLFGEVLGVVVDDAEADFFALGGHSLKVVTLLAALHRLAGVQLPLAAVFEGPTVRAIAAQLERPRRSDVLTRFGSAGDGTPLFLFPPVAGWSLVYLPFAGALTGRAVYGFDFLADGGRLLRYTDMIENAVAEGPIALGGYSAGGNLAFEVAAELERRGRTVSEIVLFDSVARPADHGDEAPIEERARENIAEGLEMLDPQVRAALSSPELIEMALERRIAFTGYWSGLEHTATVTAPLVLVAAADSALAESDEKVWAERTKGGLRRLTGSGKHREMMAGAHAVANAGLLLT